jgi:hypothetical protein
MKIIQHVDCFEVQSEDGTISKRFYFDDNASRRAISGKATRKRAYQEATTFAGKGHTIEWPEK